jgi:hypothetical protein
LHRKQTQHLSWAAGLVLIFLTISLTAGSATAQDLHRFSVSLFGGIGGSFDVSPGAGLDNDTFQLSFSLVTAPASLVSVRVGQLDFSGEKGFGIFSNADLSYLTVGGEFRSHKPFYDSGLYLALGGYRIEGQVGGVDNSDTSFGLVVGTTADFPLNRWLSILAELSGHVTDLDEAQFFGMLHVGVSVRF